MSENTLESITRQVENLDYEQQLVLVEKLISLIEQHESTSPPMNTADMSWDNHELLELLEPEMAMTGKEMVENGFTGGWEDMGIEDGADWVNHQKALRKAKRRKKLGW